MNFKKIFYAFFAGILGIFAFAPFSIKFLIFVSYTYLIYILIHRKVTQIKEVFAWGFGHWGFGMSWIIVSVYYYGETSIAVSSIIYLLLAIILTVVFTLPLLFISFINNNANIDNKVFKILFVSSSLMLSEISREYLLNGVPWLIPGNVYLDTISQNIYPIFGASSTSFVIYILCSYLVFFMKNRKINLLGFGLILLSLIPHQPKIEKGEILISIIQPSTDPFQKYEPNYFSFIDNYCSTMYCYDSFGKCSQAVFHCIGYIFCLETWSRLSFKEQFSSIPFISDNAVTVYTNHHFCCIFCLVAGARFG